jgi:sterol 3beta-glucosyltransferase
VFERPMDWNPHIHQKGYWFVEEKDDFAPDQSLIDFIQAKEKPIYIGFGSMAMMKKHDELGEIVVDAIRKSGKRAIISGFGKPGNLTDDIYAIDGIPHSWLFKHVSAVCHHGGAGTSAADFGLVYQASLFHSQTISLPGLTAHMISTLESNLFM